MLGLLVVIREIVSGVEIKEKTWIKYRMARRSFVNICRGYKNRLLKMFAFEMQKVRPGFYSLHSIFVALLVS
jgi:hypothetical protein